MEGATGHRLLLACAGLVLWLGIGGGVRAHGQDSTGCATTRPPDQPFLPPFSQWHLEPPQYWYGTASLWTYLDARAVWHTKGNVVEGKSSQKLFYWSQDFDLRTEMRPNLLLYARRLDRKAPVVFGLYPATNAFASAGEHAAMLTGVDLPPGCWKVTAHYRESTLSFVVSVEP